MPGSPTLVEIESARALLQLIGHDVARARESVTILAPAEAFPLLGPALRRAAGAGASLELYSSGSASLGFASISQVSETPDWPGSPLISVVDRRSAVIAGRRGVEVTGHWSTAPAFVAAATLALRQLATPS